MSIVCENPSVDHRFVTRKGFSLVELLAATALVTLLMILLLQILSLTQEASRISGQQLKATGSARRAMDAISNDLSHAVTTHGCALLCLPSLPNNDLALAMLTRSRGPGSPTTSTRVLGVKYSVQDRRLVREHSVVGWDRPDLLAAQLETSNSGTVIAEGILRFAVLAGLEDGTILPIDQLGPAAAVTAPGTVSGEPVPANWVALKAANISADSPRTASNSRVVFLLLAVATVDQAGLQMLEDSGTIDIFDQPMTANPVEEWENQLAVAQVPGPARSAIRFLTFPVQLK